MIKAVGCVIIARDTNRICMQMRGNHSTHPGTWSFWGGKSEHQETLLDTAVRELKEEVGDIPTVLKIHPLHVYRSADGQFEYQTIVMIVESEFSPVLNQESAGYAWVNIDCYPRPLHYGAKKILLNDDIRKKLHTIIRTVIDDNQEVSET